MEYLKTFEWFSFSLKYKSFVKFSKQKICTVSNFSEFLKVPMKRNSLFFLMKEHKKLEDCRLPFLNILFGSRLTKL